MGVRVCTRCRANPIQVEFATGEPRTKAAAAVSIGPIYDEHVEKITAQLKVAPKYDTAVIELAGAAGAAVVVRISREVLERALREVKTLRKGKEERAARRQMG